MPKIKRSHKPPPEGWDLIEPTLKELEQKLRDGKPLWVLFSRSFHFHLSTSSLSLSFCLLFQLRTSLMRGNVELKPYGPLWSFIISVLGTFMTCITRGRPLARNCMIIASRKATRIQTSLQSGRRSGKTSQGLHWFELIFQFEFEFEFELNWIFVLLCEKKPGFDNLCCLRCTQTRDTNFGTTCVCRVPKSKVDGGKVFECLHCGCRGCAG